FPPSGRSSTSSDAPASAPRWRPSRATTPRRWDGSLDPPGPLVVAGLVATAPFPVSLHTGRRPQSAPAPPQPRGRRCDAPGFGTGFPSSSSTLPLRPSTEGPIPLRLQRGELRRRPDRLDGVRGPVDRSTRGSAVVKWRSLTASAKLQVARVLAALPVG